MIVSKDTLEIIKEKGYDSIEDYIEQTAEEQGIDTATAEQIAEMLGETELFDGYISSLEDYAMMYC